MKTYISFAILLQLLILAQADPSTVTGTQGQDQNKTAATAIKISLSNMGNTQYLGEIIVGSNNVSVSVVFDTSGSWFWVPTEDSSDKPQLDSVDLYRSTESLTFNKIKEENSTLLYGKTRITGSLAYETISFGQNRIRVKNHTILLSKARQFEDESNTHGVFGLGLSNVNGHSSILETMKAQNLIQNRMFSVYLEDNINAWKTNDSEIMFGGFDPTKFKGKPIYAPLVNTKSWAVRLLDMRVGNTSLLQSTRNKTQQSSSSSRETMNFSALIDTSSNYLVIPSNAINDLIAHLRVEHQIECYYLNDNFPVCACALNDPYEFPNITISLEKDTLFLEPNAYIRRNGGVCSILLSALDPQEDQTRWKFGNVFLRAYYTIFDADKLQIGFAAANHKVSKPLSFLNAAYVAFVFILLLLIIGFFVMVLKNLCGGKDRVQEVGDDSALPIMSPSRGGTNASL